LASARRATVTKRRLCHPTCCCAYTPAVAFSTKFSVALRTDPPVTVVIGIAGNCCPWAVMNVERVR
jgi:hypothetical protein